MRTPLKRIPYNFPSDFSTIKKTQTMRNTFCTPNKIQKIDTRKNQTLDTHAPFNTGPKYSIDSLNDSNLFNLNASSSTQIEEPSFSRPAVIK